MRRMIPAAAFAAGLLSGPVSAQVLSDDFAGPSLDLDLWTLSDFPEDGVTIRQDDDRLEFSSAGDPGRAGILGNGWALSTDDDFTLRVDYSMTFGNPGATSTGLTVALFLGGTPEGFTIDDRFDLRIFRLGTLFWFQWALFANGSVVASDFGTTDANADRLELRYDADSDSIVVVSLLGADDPIAIGVGDIVADTGVDRLRLYLGGFMNGVTIAVNGDDAWWDDFVLQDGTVVEDDEEPMLLMLDARDDAAWFRRGDAAGDRFGHATRFAGDVDGDGTSDVVVGAPRDDSGGANTGSVAVFSGVDGVLLFEALGVAAGDQLGFAAHAAGDWNGDGFDDVLVGAPGHDGAGSNRGAAYVLSGAAPHAVLWSSTGEADGDRFGFAVASIGDVNNDGTDDVLVGAPFNDAGGPNAGRAYVYLGGSGALWHRKTGQEAGEQLGRVVAAAGDVDDDGDDDYVVCAPLNDRRGTNAGSVSIFSGDTGMRLHVIRGQAAGDRFGWSAAGVGDIDGDGHDDVMIGAINDDTLAANAGAVTIVSGLDGRTLRVIPGNMAGDRFGWSVASMRDLDDDGIGELAIGAPRHDAGGSNAGRVWIYAGGGGDLLAVIDGERAGGQLGLAVGSDPRPGALVGLVAGAWRFTNAGQVRRGSAYRYEFEPQ